MPCQEYPEVEGCPGRAAPAAASLSHSVPRSDSRLSHGLHSRSSTEGRGRPES
ncbi:hypothetical protein FA95DRAFT_935181 [Auriscalpium vulgare]|uniref:Uncharacterized protein n=1 Tax=Auriscalpium vulgare TaxID=40419 RepID=A0ACB8SB11_9AGAM|nr:hypothetical protein FA95DRAFT_935181 [Auriscalpium vulgare]